MENYVDNSLTVRNILKNTGIQEILDLDGITEVAVNQPRTIWYDRGNGWEFVDEPRCTYSACLDLSRAMAIYSQLGALDFNNPIASVVLPDGERGQVVIPPCCEPETVSFTIRKPSTKRFTLDDYANTGRLANAKGAKKQIVELSNLQKELLQLKDENKLPEFFEKAVTNNLNILLVGGTGSGKTTIMKALVDLYPQTKRLFTVEDVHELNLPKHPNHLHLFYKAKGCTPKQIIEACMRMKPDHVLLAELRGDEAWNYIEMLNTGHAGSITTIHANDCYSSFGRLAGLVKQSEVGKTLEYDFILKTIKTSIDVVCFFKYTHLTEIYFNPEEKNRLLSE
ncbi:P-type DNA transfer ATPase VirB11 [Vibrio harveyi]|uniref:P-type DNA transfer ATPase VirB11 n=1 Tax=Vibrio harveyi group TaxID=717610 RepID=UPI000971B4F3|nr:MULTISPECIES: P-type DNA transfer ATPase VirB11 [Vibrio harveyi group]ELY1989177.1 P-type DNA transfer ATPase VirB11 [Vibrio harveyi]APX10123.1 P-type DNA transfer ATPase VirB11 [Vibrio campbellii]ARR10588.1 secretion system protein E [Vibrio campbellii]WCP78889.1 P-type DNA transfer ATPase VirB11 [Vibrio parahaemolyticus]WHP52916.1 P-type DNA transfer ATPase VirB11 [Vibrio parahaemolyticus]